MPTSDYGFELLNPNDKNNQTTRRAALGQRTLPATLGSHKEAAQHYQPDGALVDAINVALAVGAPLLLTGEPGTGKTQVAHYLAWYFDIKLFPLYVRSDTTAEHLLYSFDAVAYLHAANDPQRGGKLPRGQFVQHGPLWLAYEQAPAVVLIDEIDKASRDFPNDLLHVLDQHEFTVRENDNQPISRGSAPPPIVVITSNVERRLPEAFLRRCIFHHIEFNEDLLRRAVAARLDDFPALDAQVREAAMQRFLELRGREIRKKPATAELLVWLTALSARGNVSVADIREARFSQLPAVSTLIKDRDDLALLDR